MTQIFSRLMLTWPEREWHDSKESWIRLKLRCNTKSKAWKHYQSKYSETLSKINLLETNFCGLNRQVFSFTQVKLRKISYIGTLLKVWFLQDSGLFWVLVYSGFWFIQDFGLFKVIFKQVSLLYDYILVLLNFLRTYICYIYICFICILWSLCYCKYKKGPFNWSIYGTLGEVT